MSVGHERTTSGSGVDRAALVCSSQTDSIAAPPSSRSLAGALLIVSLSPSSSHLIRSGLKASAPNSKTLRFLAMILAKPLR